MKLPDGTDPVPGLVGEHQGHSEPPVRLGGHPEQRFVLRLGDHHSSRVLLLGQLEAPERAGLEEEPSLLAPRLRSPVENREQEPQIVFDRPFGHRLAATAGLSRAPRPDEAVPVTLRKRLGLAVPPEEPKEPCHHGPVVVPRSPALGWGNLLTADVKKRLQGERLGLGFRRARGRGLRESGGDLVRLPPGPIPVTVLQRIVSDSDVVVTVELRSSEGRIPAVRFPLNGDSQA